MAPSARTRLGRSGEERVGAHLRGLGYRLLDRNYRCRLGEIDLIAKDSETYVFVEVKLRQRADFGHPAAGLRPKQQQRIRRAAQHYLQSLGLNPLEVVQRFDLVTLLKEGDAVTLEHFPNAF
jgi:putative endonuclease